MNKKYLAFLFLFVIGTTLLIPCHETSANGLPEGWREEVQDQTKNADAWARGSGGGLFGDFTRNVLSGVISAIVMLIYTITQAFMYFSKVFLTWVTSPGFISVPFTHNYFVDIGWGMVKDLTNILIVLGLVIIALATILRIESYQMKKTLPLLIIVALLINFTPMLCGLVIDGSNIVMDYFLKGEQALGQNYFDQFGNAWAKVWGYGDSPSSTLATGLILIGVGIFSGIIFLLFAALFLLRYIALWILVILSPLALFCYIFPGTKKMWNQWLSQFIQWCFIGIPAAFTIHLANKMTELMLQGELLGEMSSMGKIMGYMVPVAFLAGGFLMSLQTGAMGAGLAITGFKASTKWMGRETRRGVERKFKIPERAEKIGRWAAGKPFLGAVGRPLIGYAKRRGTELKKELEGLPFGTQAAITGKSVQDIVRGLGPREFAEKSRPDDITLDTFKAMSQKQVTTTGDRGKPEVIEALRNLIKDKNNAKALFQEYSNLTAQGKTQEAKRLYKNTLYVQQNPAYLP